MRLLDRNIDLGLLLLRITVGGLMLLHGIAKLAHGIGPIQGMVEASGLPSFFAYGVYIGEALVPALIILGIATRASAAVLAFNMLVAIAMAHSGDIFSLSPVGGWAIEPAAFFLLTAVVLMLTGGGKYAVMTKKIWD